MWPLRRAVLLLLLLLLAHVAVCAEDYYKVLGIQRDAGDREIKSAYRKLSKKYHPDKNPGDESAKDRFVEVSEAYEALSDAQSRKIYDQFGHDGLHKHRQGGGNHGPDRHDPFAMFSRFFGGSGHFGQAAERRGPTMEIKVAIPLRDFYRGRALEFAWDKQEVCERCAGTGSADRTVHVCAKCGGHGVVVVKHQLAPGMFQQVQMHCDQCGGRGKAVKHACPVCAGQRVVRVTTPVAVTVQPGMARDTRLVLENEADASPDYVAGDLVVVLQEKPDIHPPDDNPDRVDGAYFRRRGNDLFWTEPLSLREAWMGGWSRNLTHLDGHVVRLHRPRGHVVQPGHVDTVAGEGMPVWRPDDADSATYHPTTYGNLLVTYLVVLPDHMPPAMETDFWDLWQAWQARHGVDLLQDSGRPAPPPPPPNAAHDEL